MAAPDLAAAREAPEAGRELRTLASRTALTTATGLGGRAIKLGLHLLISRSGGVTGYGRYALGLNVMLLLENVAVAGLDQTLVRFVPAYAAAGDRARVTLVRVAWAFTTAASVLVGAVLFLLAPWLAAGPFHDPALAPTLRVFAAALVCFDWLVLGAATAQAMQAPARGSLLQDLGLPAAGAVLLAAMLLAHPAGDAPLAALAFLGSAVAVGVAAGAVAYRLVDGGRAGPASPLRRADVRRWAGFSAQMLVIETAAFGFTGLAPIVVGLIAGVGEAGLFSAAAAVIGQTNLVFAGMSTALPAMLADLLARGERERAGALLRASVRWLSWLALPACFGVAIASPVLLDVFGGGFVQAWPVVVALAWGQLVAVVLVFSGYALVQAGHQRLDMANHVVLVAAALVAYPLACRAAGAAGVALATSALNASLAVIKVVQVRRRLGVTMLDRSLWRPAAAGLAMAACWAVCRRLDAGGDGALGCLLRAGAAAAAFGLAAAVLLGDEDRKLLTDLSRASRGRSGQAPSSRPPPHF